MTKLPIGLALLVSLALGLATSSIGMECLALAAGGGHAPIVRPNLFDAACAPHPDAVAPERQDER